MDAIKIENFLLCISLLLDNMLQNTDHVKMLHVNLHNLFHCCYFFLFLLISFCSVLSITLMMNKDVYLHACVIYLFLCFQTQGSQF